MNKADRTPFDWPLHSLKLIQQQSAVSAFYISRYVCMYVWSCRWHPGVKKTASKCIKWITTLRSVQHLLLSTFVQQCVSLVWLLFTKEDTKTVNSFESKALVCTPCLMHPHTQHHYGCALPPSSGDVRHNSWTDGGRLKEIYALIIHSLWCSGYATFQDRFKFIFK